MLDLLTFETFKKAAQQLIYICMICVLIYIGLNCVYVCVYVYIYMYMYIYTHTHTMAESVFACARIHYLISECKRCVFSVKYLNIFGCAVSSAYVLLYAVLLFGVHKVSTEEKLVWFC